MEVTSLALEALHIVWITIKVISQEKRDAKDLHAFFENQLDLCAESFKQLLVPSSNNESSPELEIAVSE